MSNNISMEMVTSKFYISDLFKKRVADMAKDSYELFVNNVIIWSWIYVEIIVIIMDLVKWCNKVNRRMILIFPFCWVMKLHNLSVVEPYFGTNGLTRLEWHGLKKTDVKQRSWSRNQQNAF